MARPMSKVLPISTFALRPKLKLFVRGSALMAFLVAALVLAGCGDSDDSTEPGSEPTTQQPTAPPATATQSTGGAPIGAQAQSCKTGSVALSELRATGVDCGAARRVMFAWADAGGRCRPEPGGSRSACSIKGYRCLAVAVGTGSGGGTAVNCAAQGRSISFRHGRIKSQ
jgi:hypothetical protein